MADWRRFWRRVLRTKPARQPKCETYPKKTAEQLLRPNLPLSRKSSQAASQTAQARLLLEIVHGKQSRFLSEIWFETGIQSISSPILYIELLAKLSHILPSCPQKSFEFGASMTQFCIIWYCWKRLKQWWGVKIDDNAAHKGKMKSSQICLISIFC